MHLYIFLLLLLCYNVRCEECVTYNFEENYEPKFTNAYGICSGMSTWSIGNYSSLSIESPHERSSRFLMPQTTLSCVSSFKFSISISGTLEIKAYMSPAVNSDQITVLAFQSLEDRPDATIGNVVLTPRDSNFVSGWQTLRMQIIGIGQSEGYITFLGMASPGSIVIIDSFRYIPPSYDSEMCKIYGDEETTTIAPTSTTTSTTIQPSTTSVLITSTTRPPTTTSALTSSIIQSTTTAGITTSTTRQPTTTSGLTTSTTSTTIQPSTTVTVTPTTSTTGAVSTPSSSTERPRVSISILLIRINKFFR